MILKEGYSKHDFDLMMYNVMEIPDGTSVIDAFPEFKIYNEFSDTLELEEQGVDVDLLMRYIILLYDHHSPLKQHANLIKRKLEAAQMAGFETNSEGYFEEVVDAAMKGLNPLVNKMIIRFCRMQGSSIYSALVTVNEAYNYKLQLTLSAPGDHKNKSEIELEKIKGQLWDQAKAMLVDIERLTRDLISEDNSPYLRKDLFCVIDRDGQELMLTPEKIAARGKVEA